jgi:hypothetical protein
MNTDTDHSDLAPPDQSIETTDDSQFLDLGGVSIHGSREERRALFSALAKAQASYTPIVKDEVNPHFKKAYATLDSVLSGTRPALNGQGLALVNAVSDANDGSRDLHTMLTHEGGGVLHMTMKMAKVEGIQQLGAQITYARRYSIQSVTCTAPDVDDDGNQGQGLATLPIESKQKQQKAPDPKPQKPAEAPQKVPSVPPPANDGPELMTTEQASQIGEEFVRLGWPKMRAAEHAQTITGMTSKTMTMAAANVLLFDLRGREAGAQ